MSGIGFDLDHGPRIRRREDAIQSWLAGNGETWSTEDSASMARTPAGLGSSIIPAKSYFAGLQNRCPQFKSRPRKFITFALLISNLHTIQT
jgi:hypothetical protein